MSVTNTIPVTSVAAVPNSISIASVAYVRPPIAPIGCRIAIAVTVTVRGRVTVVSVAVSGSIAIVIVAVGRSIAIVSIAVRVSIVTAPIIRSSGDSTANEGARGKPEPSTSPAPAAMSETAMPAAVTTMETEMLGLSRC
jgi:hypothetical protein